MDLRRFLHSGFVLCAGVLGIATASVQNQGDLARHQRKVDLREGLLRNFLFENQCPDYEYAGMFLAEADTHGLDWRLLPALSVIESGGGRTARGNNLFGWANGRVRFTSIGQSIHHVASALSQGKPYAGKTLKGKLAAYNQNPSYHGLVVSLMSQISPTIRVAAAR